ncbi:POTRA domain-containing protein [Aquimarina sp. 2201CG5-10]|uniref:POTRA domain-containing protein n=1 Tax=Aquimarina callyspongiae TaxID=3098150 RepID=UPI002AB33ECA|nr:POTRA domain-containing protein [Aquimarina sp. 2201CG5-10]MDY8134771.1 POTRA domain-containing protein [Aquimarina sp. 2201CG5-10]
MKKTLTCIVFLVCSIAFTQESDISELKIQGLKRTKESFIRRLVKVKPETAYDSLRIVTDIERLKRLPGIANATYTVIKNADQNYSVSYNIEENFTIIPGLNIATDNNGEFAFRVSLFEFNLLGRNQILGGFYQRDVFDSYGGYWEAPYLFTNKFGFGINYKNLVSQEPVFFENDNTVDYKFDSKSLEVNLLYEFNFHNRAEIGINISNETYDFIQGDLPEGIPTQLNADKIAYRGEYEYNNLKIDYQYVSGYRSLLDFRFVTGGDEFLKNFFIGRNDFEYFKRVGEKGNWANRLRLGYASNDDSPFAPFAVDNQLNIRGAGNTIDRGTASIVLNTEYRHTLYEKGWFVIQSNTFIDTGTWREPGGDLSGLADGSTLRFYPGLGIRFIHKRIFNAVFRLDYGYGIGDKATNGITFGIGQYF